MAISFVQDIGSAQGTSTGTSVTLTTAALTVGNVVLVTVRWNNTTAKPVSLSDGANNWIPVPNTVVQNGSLGTGFSEEIWYAFIGTGGVRSLVATVTSGGGSNYFIDVKGAEFSGVESVYAVDQYAGQTGNTTPATPSITTTNADDVLYAAFFVNGVTLATPSGWTALASNVATFYYDFWKIVSSTGSYACTTTAGTTQFDGSIVALKAAPATAPAIVGNAGIAGATVSWTGPASGSTTSASDGSFTIPNLSSGTYTITPTLTGYTFTPTSSSKAIAGSSVGPVNFQPNFNRWVNQGIAIPQVSSDAPEQPTVIYEATAHILTPNIDGKIFKMWFTTGPASAPTGINYAESNDGITWTRYGSNPVLASRWGSRIFKNGSTYFMYCSSQVFASAIQCYTSTDGLAWTLQNATAIVTGSGFESAAVGQLNVLAIVSGTWYGYYWGTQNTGPTANFYIGLATSSDGITWTKDGGNPVTGFDGGTLANGQSWNGAFSPCFATVNGKYYAWGQIACQSYPAATASQPSDLMRVKSTSPSGPWTAINSIPYGRTLASEEPNSFKGQVADPCIIEALGNVYLYYTASVDGTTGSTYTVNCATITGSSIAALVGTHEGVQNVPISGKPSLNLNVLASDNFTRSNANPVGGNWNLRFYGASYAPAQIVSNTLEGTVAGSNSDSYWNALNWADNQWSKVTVGACSAVSFVGIVLRASLNNATDSAYRLYWTGSTGSSGTLTLQKAVSGSYTTLKTATITLNVGDTLLGVAIGSTLMFFWNDLLIFVVTDTALTSGAPGFLISPTTSTSNAQLTAWSGGNFMNPPNYGISGSVTATGASATMTWSGSSSGSVAADGSGNYNTGEVLLPLGEYTITPTKIGYTFTPGSQNETIADADITGVNFTAAISAAGSQILVFFIE